MRDLSLSLWNTVGLKPRRIVPPMCVREISGMNMTTGLFESAANSADLAPARKLAPSGRQDETVRTREAHDVAGPLDNRKLEAEANTEEWYFLLACPLDC